MKLFLNEILQYVGGLYKEVLLGCHKSSFECVSTDTRTINKGDIYVALKGEVFDGNKFIDDAIKKGAALVILSDEEYIPNEVSSILVDDTVIALGRLAALYRSKLDAVVIGITGSVGKTSTREMVVKALEAQGKTHTTAKNNNNEIGLAKSILSCPEDASFLVLEMGMRGLGEISYLTNIACPDIGIITNIGYSHIGILKSKENIRKAKFEILEGFSRDSTLIVNSDDPFVEEYIEEKRLEDEAHIVRISPNGNIDRDLCASNISFGNILSYSCLINGAIENVTLSSVGYQYVVNSMFAIAVVESMKRYGFPDIDIHKSIQALYDYHVLDGRGKIYKTPRYTIINDAYNASLESMNAAFFTLDKLTSNGRKIAVLGGILETGNYSSLIHSDIGRSLALYDFDRILVIGEDKNKVLEGYRENKKDDKLILLEDNIEIRNHLDSYLDCGDIVLFKASNAFGFEVLAREYIAKGESLGGNDE